MTDRKRGKRAHCHYCGRRTTFDVGSTVWMGVTSTELHCAECRQPMRRDPDQQHNEAP